MFAFLILHAIFRRDGRRAWWNLLMYDQFSSRKRYLIIQNNKNVLYSYYDEAISEACWILNFSTTASRIVILIASLVLISQRWIDRFTYFFRRDGLRDALRRSQASSNALPWKKWRNHKRNTPINSGATRRRHDAAKLAALAYRICGCWNVTCLK